MKCKRILSFVLIRMIAEHKKIEANIPKKQKTN